MRWNNYFVYKHISSFIVFLQQMKYFNVLQLCFNILSLCKCRKKYLTAALDWTKISRIWTWVWDYLFCWGMLKISLKNYSFYFVLRNFSLETGQLGFSYEAIVKWILIWSHQSMVFYTVNINICTFIVHAIQLNFCAFVLVSIFLYKQFSYFRVL